MSGAPSASRSSPSRCSSAGGNRRERGEIVLPQRCRRECDRGDGDDQRDPRHRARTRHASDPRANAFDERQRGRIVESRRQQRRQAPARRHARDEQTNDGEHGELLQSGHAGNEEREIGDARRHDGEPQQRPHRRDALLDRHTGLTMAEHADRIFLRDAEQRESERERDAVHVAEGERDRGESGERAARERQIRPARSRRDFDTRRAAAREIPTCRCRSGVRLRRAWSRRVSRRSNPGR